MLRIIISILIFTMGYKTVCAVPDELGLGLFDTLPQELFEFFINDRECAVKLASLNNKYLYQNFNSSENFYDMKAHRPIQINSIFGNNNNKLTDLYRNSIWFSHAANSWASCALRKDGSIGCFQTSNSTNAKTIVEHTPKENAFVSIVANLDFMYALKNDGTVHCWGINGACLDGGVKTENMSDSHYAAIYSNPYQVCGTKFQKDSMEQTVYCWQHDPKYSFEYSYTISNSIPSSLVLGIGFACLLNENKNIQCDFKNGLTFKINQSMRFNKIVATHSSVCGIGEDEKLYCYGHHEKKIPTLEQIENLNISIKDIFTNKIENVCLLASTGVVYCWDTNKSQFIKRFNVQVDKQLPQYSIATQYEDRYSFLYPNHKLVTFKKGFLGFKSKSVKSKLNSNNFFGNPILKDYFLLF